AVPDAAGLAGLDLAGLCAWTARLAGDVGAAPRAVELARRAIELIGAGDPHRVALLHIQLSRYLYAAGRDDAALAELERAVELVPAQPSSPERAASLAALAGGLMIAWRHEESLPIAERALAVARAVARAGRASPTPWSSCAACSRAAGVSATRRAHTSRLRPPLSARTAGSACTTPGSRTSPSGSAASRTRTRP